MQIKHTVYHTLKLTMAQIKQHIQSKGTVAQFFSLT